MTKTIKVMKPTEISTILNKVHDRFFIIEDIIFDHDDQYLKITISVIDDEGHLSRKYFFIKQWIHNIFSLLRLLYGML